MNNKQRALLAMLQDNMTTAQCLFAGSAQEYTYKVDKAWDVKAGDSLVVKSPRTGLTVVQVVSVDKSSRIDEANSAAINYTWAVSKVDLAGYEAQLLKEANFLEQLAEVDRLHKKLAMLTKVRETLGANEEATKAFAEAVKALQS